MTSSESQLHVGVGVVVPSPATIFNLSPLNPGRLGFTRQPENSNRAHSKALALQTPPEKTHKRKKERKVAGERKKARNKWAPNKIAKFEKAVEVMGIDGRVHEALKAGVGENQGFGQATSNQRRGRRMLEVHSEVRETHPRVGCGTWRRAVVLKEAKDCLQWLEVEQATMTTFAPDHLCPVPLLARTTFGPPLLARTTFGPRQFLAVSGKCKNGAPRVGPRRVGAQNFALFFSLPQHFLSSSGSFRGILVVFEGLTPTLAILI